MNFVFPVLAGDLGPRF